MMNLLSLLRKKPSYESRLWLESKTISGVRFSIRRISLGQRINLSTRIRELTLRNEFLRAGQPADHLEAAMADLLVQKLYIEWALVDLEGISIDGKPGSVALLIERGPECLLNEIAGAIRAEMELSDAERKN